MAAVDGPAEQELGPPNAADLPAVSVRLRVVAPVQPDEAPRRSVRRQPLRRGGDEGDVGVRKARGGAARTILHILECNCNEWQNHSTSKNNTRL